MKINDVLINVTSLLSENNIELPRLEAEILLSNILNKDRVYLYTHPDEIIEQEALDRFDSYIQRRIKKEPIAYIIGKKEFMGLDFIVNNNVLIPRPDSETIVETAIRLINSSDNLKNKYEKGELKVLDLCAGSGALGLSLKYNLSRINLTLSDISSAAVEVIKQNSDSLNLKTEILVSDLFENIKDNYDLIISNPPYIKEEDIINLPDDIKNYEPHIALSGGASGYYFYRKIIQESIKFLNKNGYLLVEAGDNQSDTIKEIYQLNGYEGISSERDLINVERVVYANL